MKSASSQLTRISDLECNMFFVYLLSVFFFCTDFIPPDLLRFAVLSQPVPRPKLLSDKGSPFLFPWNVPSQAWSGFLMNSVLPRWTTLSQLQNGSKQVLSHSSAFCGIFCWMWLCLFVMIFALVAVYFPGVSVVGKHLVFCGDVIFYWEDKKTKR